VALRETMTKHSLVMLACCLVPMALLGLVLATGVSLGGLAPYAMIVLCPLLHVVMMRGMGHGHSTRAGDSGEKEVVPVCHDLARPTSGK